MTIISHSKKFIYIKTPKTAGTSTEQYLSLFCDPNQGDEVVTPHSESPFRKGNTDSDRHLSADKPMAECASIQDVKRYLLTNFPNQNIWDTYYKFVVIRNPWDMILSNAWYHRSHEYPMRKIKTKKWAKYLIARFLLRSEIQFYVGQRIAAYEKRKFRYSLDGLILANHSLEKTTDGKLICPMNQVVRYEDLYAGLGEVCEKLNIPWQGRLEYGGRELRVKGKLRQNRQHYRDVYTTKQASRIGEIYKEFNEIFGYRY